MKILKLNLDAAHNPNSIEQAFRSFKGDGWSLVSVQSGWGARDKVGFSDQESVSRGTLIETHLASSCDTDHP